MGRYGNPSQILSDNGTQFVNETIAELLKLVGTEHILTMAYSKEENAIVERSNKEVMRHMRAIIFHTNIISDWWLNLPIIQRIMNASENESIGVSPAQIIFGNAIQLDRGIFLPSVSGESGSSLSEWTANMLRKQGQIIAIAQATQSAKDDRHVAEHTAERTEFPINSYVLVQYPSTNLKPGGPTKIHTNLKGPYRVVNSIGSRYTVQNLVSNKNEDFHVTQLRPFLFDAEEVNPAAIAMKDQQFWLVESIVDHRGHPKRKADMTFRVRWSGYGPESDTWEPWKQVRTNKRLHEYLRQHGMQSMIPKQFESG